MSTSVQELVTVRELCQVFAVAQPTILYWMGRGMPTARKKPYLFDLEAVRQWLLGRQRRVVLSAEERERRAAETPEERLARRREVRRRIEAKRASNPERKAQVKAAQARYRERKLSK